MDLMISRTMEEFTIEDHALVTACKTHPMKDPQLANHALLNALHSNNQEPMETQFKNTAINGNEKDTMLGHDKDHQLEITSDNSANDPLRHSIALCCQQSPTEKSSHNVDSLWWWGCWKELTDITGIFRRLSQNSQAFSQRSKSREATIAAVDKYHEPPQRNVKNCRSHYKKFEQMTTRGSHHHHHHHNHQSNHNQSNTTIQWLLPMLTLLAVLSHSHYLLPVASAFECGPCEGVQCPSPVTCVGGMVRDHCGCCLTCARQVNETCGGPGGAHGRCDKGLTCTIEPDHGADLQDGHHGLQGVCTAPREISLEQVCDLSACGDVGQTFTCPNDSTTVTKPATVCCPPSDTCRCLPCDDNLQCGLDQLKVKVSDAPTGLPGNCCPTYECKDIVELCANVTCPTQETTSCPDDSLQLPDVATEHGCCLTHGGCKCKLKDECPAVTCPPGQRVRVVAPATGQPGSCCDKTQCEEGITCKYGDQEYEDGDTWSPKPCTTCSCKSKLVFCSTAKCENSPPPMCGWLGLGEDSPCCHVCKGCMAVDGERYANGERWEQDACTTCRCEAGVRYCQAASCRIECSHPRKVAGRCCPVCDDEIMVTLPPHCPKDDNCTLMCWNGRKQDEHGCYTCECNPDPEPTEECNLDCPAGYKVNAEGKQICECIETDIYSVTQHPHCPLLTRCKKHCVYGFKRNKHGCERCRCKKCPEFSCKKKCIHGYVYNNKGCKVCKCREPDDDKVIQPTDFGSVLPPVHGGAYCMSIDGRRMEDGETWYDGCRRCFCHDRFEWCSLITCPVLMCKNPVIRPADCCPTCPEDDPNALVPGEPTQCQASGGTFRTEGETWQLDACTKCICHAGGVLCQIESCPPLFCNMPVRLPGQCCPLCPEGHDFFPLPPVQTPRSCTTSTGAKFADGDSWKVNACQSCVCHAGQVHCFSQTCPLLTCNHTLLKKGQCCPFCVEEHATNTCRHEGETYSTGESWLIENCRQCMCDHGHVICSKMICPPPRCRRPVHIPGICCSICTNATYEPTEPSVVEQIPPASVPNRTKAPRDDINDVPQHDSHFQAFSITVGILGAVVIILILCIIALLIVLYRTRRKTEAPLDSPKVTEVLMPRPKSTNVELQGFTPMTHNGNSGAGGGGVVGGGGGLVNGGVHHSSGKVNNDGTTPMHIVGGYDGPVVKLRSDSSLNKKNHHNHNQQQQQSNIVGLNQSQEDNNKVMLSNNLTKPENNKQEDDLKAYRNSCVDTILIGHNLTIPTDPNDFRKSV